MAIKTLVVAAAVVTLLSGCNAARGLGQDIENLGLLMQGKKAQKKTQLQQGQVVSEEVTPVPAEVVTDPAVEVTPLPAEGQVEVYPYPYPQEQGGQAVYTAPVPEQTPLR
jgi:predicted small secreted protein